MNTTNKIKFEYDPIRKVNKRSIASANIDLNTDGMSVFSELPESHAAEPIKDKAQLLRIENFLRENHRWRDLTMFVCGINLGLRISDLLQLKLGNLGRFEEQADGTARFVFFDEILVDEIKTRNTRLRKLLRHLHISLEVVEVVTEFIEHYQEVYGCKITLDTYLFKSESNRCKNKNVPLSRQSADRLLKKIAKEVGLEGIQISTHTLRKTFCYHKLRDNGSSDHMLHLLQHMLNHASLTDTMSYIGLTQEEYRRVYMKGTIHGNNSDEITDLDDNNLYLNQVIQVPGVPEGTLLA